MAKQHRSGAQVGDVVVLKGDPTQLRKIRCPNCAGLAAVRKDANGKEICICGTCGRTFKSTKI